MDNCDLKCLEDCAQVHNVRTMACCPSKPIPVAKDTVKVPVVLAETKIQIDVEADIQLDQPAVEIKRIKKDVFLEQCELVLNSNKLFLKGYVRKNIEYVPVSLSSCKGGFCGYLRTCTVDVPFECATPIQFSNKPDFAVPRIDKEFEFEDDDDCCCDKKESDHFFTFEKFNEKPFCELVSATIFEEDIHLHPKKFKKQKFSKCFVGSYFDCFREKMVIFLKLKVLQNQQVQISNATKPAPKKKCRPFCGF
ncbi:CsxC family protein [Desulforamulus ruminis]|uniref:DUF7852 domain-containing protein n=1 Tax=Desulforamulus ruminis (strain ATCC 23193 / DSM 2154 / NCIMB 8452 / DL) TaxID=696281 RepID=F6DQ59_DESRL|nr:hypothetical protein [Desulforamulus ruminis]AEG62003.1 hypothetical protein Desru_3803 [Desulforamulus ruminis DSM 2154]